MRLEQAVPAHPERPRLSGSPSLREGAGGRGFSRRRRFLAILAGAWLLALAIPLGIAWRRAVLVAPPPTLLLEDRHGEFLAEVGAPTDGDAGYWPLAQLPPRVAAATLAAEDHRYWSHPGVDPRAVARAIWQDLSRARRVSGASTIEMQVARLEHPGPRTLGRKAMEALTALCLVRRHSREEILLHYLTIAPYGNRVRGVSYAARRYLDKPVDDLSWAETAFLAALPQAPGRMNPFDAKGRAAAVKRGRRILGTLHDEGTIGDADYSAALDQIEGLYPPARATRPPEAMHAVLELERMLDEPARRRLGDRPIVRTSIDLDLQRAASDAAADAVRRWEAKGAGNAAVIVLDARTAEVLAWVGSTDWSDAKHAGAIDYASVPRSPGSTLKPFFYARALDERILTPASIVDDLPRADGTLTDADQQFLGPLLPRVALANSRNIPAVGLLEAMGLDPSYGFLCRLGLSDGSLPPDHYGPGMATGNLPVTLASLVRAYDAFPSGGVLRDPVWYPGQPAASERVLSEGASRQIARWLSDPLARMPTFPRMGATEYPFPVAAKTGTSSGYRDAWTIAWSERHLVGVWVGHPDWRPMNGLGGFQSAALLAREVLLPLEAGRSEGLADLGFPPPRGASPVKICALTGKRATDACPQVFVEWLDPSDAPADDCDAHRRQAIDVRTGALATSRTPRELVDVRTFVSLDPHYAAWAKSAGLVSPPGVTLSSTTARVRVASPANGLRLLRDPEAPADLSTLRLEAVVDPPTPQVVWYVDGKPFEVAAYPYAARWPLAPGAHVIQARLPFRHEVSAPVTVQVD